MNLKRIGKFLITYFYPFFRYSLFFFRLNNDSVKVIVFFKNKVLLIKNTYRQGWTFPGGGVKKNESYEQAAIREVHEEVAINISKLKNHGFLNLDSQKSNKTIVFSCEVTKSNLKIDNLEVEKAVWINIDRVSHLPLLPVAAQCAKLLNLQKPSNPITIV
jgi:ADP-ribose pyrophosphatase YjhB (NUDIX family)